METDKNLTSEEDAEEEAMMMMGLYDNNDDDCDDPEIEAALQTLVGDGVDENDGDPMTTTTTMMMMHNDVVDDDMGENAAQYYPSSSDGSSNNNHHHHYHHSVSPSTIGSDRNYVMTGRPPQMLYLSCDGDSMTPYQQLLRKQIEFFEADSHEVSLAAQGRNKPIVIGQVGIRCRHCALSTTPRRGRGAVYFPSKLENIYQMVSRCCCILWKHVLSDSLYELLSRRLVSSFRQTPFYVRHKIWQTRILFRRINALPSLPTFAMNSCAYEMIGPL